MPSVSQIISSLPRPVRLRFDSIGGYAQGVVNQEQESLPRNQHLTTEELEMVKLVVFCFAANRFFKEGSEAARGAVDEFQRFNIPGFQVGSAHFERRNRNVMLGDHLAVDLMHAFDGNPLQHLILNANSMTELIHDLARRMRHERRVG